MSNANLLADLTEPDCAAWDYVAGFETPEQYDAFAYYRDQGPTRTVSSAARALGVGPGTMYAWAHQGLWAVRVASYDSHRTREREALRKTAEANTDAAWAEERAELDALAHRIANLAMAQTLHDLQSGRTRLRPNEAARFYDRVQHWRNTNNGDATERIDGLPDYSNMSDEQLKELRAATELVRSKLGSKDDDE